MNTDDGICSLLGVKKKYAGGFNGFIKRHIIGT